MDWLLKNPQLIIFAVFIVITALVQRANAQKARREQEKEDTLRTPDDAHPTANTATDDDYHTRQAQEEIRRKILARMEAAEAQQPRRPTPMPRTDIPHSALRTPHSQVTRTPDRTIARAWRSMG